MRDAQTFLEAARLANIALTGIHFTQISREKGESTDANQLKKVEEGINLLETVLKTLEARERQEKLSDEALSVLYVLSQGRMVEGTPALKRLLSDSIEELRNFKERKSDSVEDAEDLLEIIAKSTSEEAAKAASKIRVFMTEAR